MTTAHVAISSAQGGELTIAEVKVGPPRPDEVVIDVVSSGICHTDIASHNGLFGTKKPVVLGHEGAGVVREAGTAVTGIRPGDKVAMTMSGCGQCPVCLCGDTTYCSHVFELNMAGGRPDGSSAYEGVLSHFGRQSSFSDVAVAPQQSVVVLPADTDLSLVSPLGCGLMTGAGAVLLSLQVRAGTAIAIFGAGAVGLGAVMAAALSGVSRIIVIDRFQSRLETALDLGATDALIADGDLAAQIKDLSGGGVQFALEASGNTAALTTAVASLGHRGVCGIVGTPGVGILGSFEWSSFQTRGASIRGICLGDANGKLFLPDLLSYHASGKFPFERIITTYPFERINDAFADAESGRTIKPVLQIGD